MRGNWTIRTMADGTVQRRWTENELMELDDLLADGWSDERIAKRLNRSVNAVKIKWTRKKLRARSHRIMTGRTVAKYMGWGCAKKVSAMIRCGALKGKQGQRIGKSHMWYVTEEALIEFMQDPRYWARWRAEDIAHPGYRMWAEEFRTDRYLTVGQVAEMFNVTVRAVGAWIRKGQLPAVKWANWQILETDAKAFVPPCQRSKAGYSVNRWTRGQKIALTRYRNQGMTFQEIADRMGLPLGAVANRWYRRAA